MPHGRETGRVLCARVDAQGIPVSLSVFSEIGTGTPMFLSELRNTPPKKGTDQQE